MKVVVDTNIVISALIRSNGVVGSVLLNALSNHTVLSCYYLYVEVFDKKAKIQAATKFADQDLLELLYLVIRRIEFVNEQQIADGIWQEARKLTAGIDVKDVSFVALALQTDAYLWTGDKPLHDGLIKRGFSKVVNTEELLLLLQHID